MSLNFKKLVVIFVSLGIFAFWVYFRDKRELIQRIYPVQKIQVKIEGEVKSPGIYQIPAGSQLKDLIDLAGGLTQNAVAREVPWEMSLSDGQLVKIGTGN